MSTHRGLDTMATQSRRHFNRTTKTLSRCYETGVQWKLLARLEAPTHVHLRHLPPYLPSQRYCPGPRQLDLWNLDLPPKSLSNPPALLDSTPIRKPHSPTSPIGCLWDSYLEAAQMDRTDGEEVWFWCLSGKYRKLGSVFGQGGDRKIWKLMHGECVGFSKGFGAKDL